METIVFEIARELYDFPMLSEPNTGNDCIPHFHKQFEALFVVSGEVKATINNQTKILTNCQFSIADEYDVHSYESDGNALAICFAIPYTLQQEYNIIKGDKVLTSNFVTDQTTAKSLKEILDLLRTYWNGNDLLQQSLIKTFLGLIVDRIGFKENENPSVIEKTKIFKLINKYLKAQNCLELVAKELGYTKYYFSSQFKKLTSLRFDEYLNMQRVCMAKMISMTKKVPIISLCYEVGFSSLSSFYRCYSKYFKESPKKIRENPMFDSLTKLSMSYWERNLPHIDNVMKK